MAPVFEALSLSNVVFRSFVFWSTVMILKMLAMSALTAMQRFKTKVCWKIRLIVAYQGELTISYHSNCRLSQILKTRKHSRTWNPNLEKKALNVFVVPTKMTSKTFSLSSPSPSFTFWHHHNLLSLSISSVLLPSPELSTQSSTQSFLLNRPEPFPGLFATQAQSTWQFKFSSSSCKNSQMCVLIIKWGVQFWLRNKSLPIKIEINVLFICWSFKLF